MRAMLFAIALALALAPAIGCTREEPAVGTVAVVAPLWVAPVAEDHPWVIAFLTTVSITPPPGVDAQLEGRTDSTGRVVMEPMLGADNKDVLAEFLREHEQTHPRPPELAPVWELHLPTPGHPQRWQLHFIDTRAGFAIDGGASATLVRQGSAPVVRLKLSPAQGEQFAKLTRAQLGRRVAFAIGDEILDVPIMLEPITTGEVTLRGHSSRNTELAAQALLERLQQAN